MFYQWKKKILVLLCSVLVLTSIGGCTKFSLTSAEDKSFEAFTNDLFQSEITTNTINLHYTLADPKKYGIDDYPITFGTLSSSEMEKSSESIQTYYDTLQSFNFEELSKENQVTYDILSMYFENELGSKDLKLFYECLSPTIGTQAQLPILLAEYAFYHEDDIKDYLALLSTLDTYYKSIVAFEEEKSEAGLFMSDIRVDGIINQCKTFIEDPKSNYLIDMFNEKIDDFKGLNEEEKETYKKDHVKILYDHVIPAYQVLINGLTSLKGTGNNDGGLVHHKNGAAYYEYLLRANTGIYDSVDDLQKRLNSQLVSDFTTMQEILQNNPGIIKELSTVDIPEDEPENILVNLKKKMKQDFPTPPDTNFQVKYVHESLEKHLSPAFYLTPPIDKIKDNVIYINPSAHYNNIELFTTLAHEGYPGHLYQTTYSSKTDPNLARNILNFGGYVEGWATYVEMYSYSLIEMDPNLATLLKLNQSMILCLYSNIDIGVHYNGWSREETARYLADFGFTDSQVADSIFDAIVEDPTNYLRYYMGYLKFFDMKTKTEAALGDKFSLKDYHKFLLDLGPAQFPIVDKYLDIYIENKK